MRYLLILISFFLISLATATPTLNLQHEQTQAGETILATISTLGEFTKQIEPSDLKFFEGRKQVSLESDIIFYQEKHYLYIYATRPANLTLQIQNILYKEAGTLQSTTITKQLNITEKTNQTLTIKPGFIFTTTIPKIKLINSGTSSLNLTCNENETSLSPFQTLEVILTPSQTLSFLNISTYKDFSIPIIYLKATQNTTFISPSIKPDLRADITLLFLELFTENKTQSTIQLFNFGDQNITDIKTTHNTSFLKIEKLENIQPRGAQNLTLSFQPKTPGHFQDKINITYIQNQTKSEIQVSLSIFVLPKGTIEKNFQIKEETCQEISGQICEEGTICNGDATFTKNSEYCCLATCIKIKDDNSEISNGFGWILAIAIFIILGIAGYTLYKKQKKFKSQTPKDKLSEISKKFEKRLAVKSNRITDGLTKS